MEDLEGVPAKPRVGGAHGLLLRGRGELPAAQIWDDVQLADFDPRLSPEVAREYREYAAFASDPQAVRVELLGEGRVRLFVSREYLEFARREGVECFIDFEWMRNAFIIDYLARELAAQGYTSGVLVSYDGFVRCLDGSGEGYSLSVYDRSGEDVRAVALMGYQGPMSIAALRDYPVNAIVSFINMGKYRSILAGVNDLVLAVQEVDPIPHQRLQSVLLERIGDIHRHHLQQDLAAALVRAVPGKTGDRVPCHAVRDIHIGRPYLSGAHGQAGGLSVFYVSKKTRSVF